MFDQITENVKKMSKVLTNSKVALIPVIVMISGLSMVSLLLSEKPFFTVIKKYYVTLYPGDMK